MKRAIIGLVATLALVIAAIPFAVASAQEAGPLDHVVISPTTANITSGHTQQFTAVAQDSNNVTIPDLSFTWAVVAGGGTIDGNGLFTAGSADGTFVNTVNVTATQGGITKSAFATVIVTAQILDHVVISPTTADVTVDETEQFTAVGQDSGNVTIPGLPFTWTVVNGGGAIDGNGLFTAGNTTGTFANTVNVTATQDSIARSAFATVIVTDRILDHVVISPVTANITAGSTQQFTAVGQDADNVTIPGLSFTWSVVNGGGTIDANGLFTAGNTTGTFVNTVNVTATQGSITKSAFATVIVTAAAVEKPPVPPGFSHGEKNGWQGGDTPPGWSQGRKTGWDGEDMPPGLNKDNVAQAAGNKGKPGGK